MSTTSKRAGSSKSGAGSRASKTKSFTYKGTKLTVSTEIPDTFYWDIGEIMRLSRLEDPGAFGAMREALFSILTEEDIPKLRGLVKNPDEESALFRDAIEAAGFKWGEA